MTNKHDHITGRTRPYISRKYFHKARHRGIYRKRAHWSCKNCTSNCNCPIPYGVRDVKITPYLPVYSPFAPDDAVTIKFTSM